MRVRCKIFNHTSGIDKLKQLNPSSKPSTTLSPAPYGGLPGPLGGLLEALGGLLGAPRGPFGGSGRRFDVKHDFGGLGFCGRAVLIQ